MELGNREDQYCYLSDAIPINDKRVHFSSRTSCGMRMKNMNMLRHCAGQEWGERFCLESVVYTQNLMSTCKVSRKLVSMKEKKEIKKFMGF